MGMAASQCRLLCLTARLSDLELKAQTISNAKIRLSMESEDAANEYSDALNKEHLQLLTGITNGTSNYTDLTYDSLTGINSPLLAQYGVSNSSGQLLVTSAQEYAFKNAADATAFVKAFAKDPLNPTSQETNHYTAIYNRMKNENGGYFTVPRNSDGTSNETNTLKSTQWIQDQIAGGNLITEQISKDGKSTKTSYGSDSNIHETRDKSDEARATAKYEAIQRRIETKDKQFDLELKNIDTEHSATQTEIDSVKKVIQSNIERNFKIFQG